jgi:hypothetical protein
MSDTPRAPVDQRVSTTLRTALHEHYPGISRPGGVRYLASMHRDASGALAISIDPAYHRAEFDGRQTADVSLSHDDIDYSGVPDDRRSPKYNAALYASELAAWHRHIERHLREWTDDLISP